MSRRPAPLDKTTWIPLSDLPPVPGNPWQKTVPRWLFKAAVDGLLSHVAHIPGGKRRDLDTILKGRLQFIFAAVVFAFEVHPQERLKWTEVMKRDAVKMILAHQEAQKGQPPDHTALSYGPQASLVQKYLYSNEFPFTARNSQLKLMWLEKHLPKLLGEMRRFGCTEWCPRITSPPNRNHLEKWRDEKHLSQGTLLYEVLGHHHRVKYATAYKWISKKPVRHALPEQSRDRMWTISESMSLEEWHIALMTNVGLRYLQVYNVPLP
jgi:hypothetical protein